MKWNVVAIQGSPDSKVVAGTGYDGRVCLWSVETGELLFPPLKGHQAGAKFAIFSSDGRTLITYGDDKTTRWWNVATGREMLVLKDMAPVWRWRHVAPAAAWDLGGRFLVWQQPQGVIQVMPLPTLSEIDAAESLRTKTGLRR